MKIKVYAITHGDAYGYARTTAAAFINKEKAEAYYKARCEENAWWGAKDIKLEEYTERVDIEDIEDYIKIPIDNIITE